MKRSAAKQLHELQQSLFQKAYREACSYSTVSSHMLNSYSSAFFKSVPPQFVRCQQSKMVEDLLRADLVLYGDFHTLAQSQKGLIRILRQLKATSDREIVLCMESFFKTDQDVLDQFSAGDLGQDEFLEKISYQETWGFSWKNYKRVVDYAIEHDIEILGINEHSNDLGGLSGRDVSLANNLLEIKERNPEKLIVCLIGEFHLADEHLPRCLQRQASLELSRMNVIRILSNVDEYYFKLASDFLAINTEFLQLSEKMYCIINSPPWIKWQSLSNWEETRHFELNTLDEELDEEEFDFAGNSPDLDQQVIDLCLHLKDFLGLEVPKSEIENIYVMQNPSAEKLSELQAELPLSDSALKRVIIRLGLRGACRIDDSNALLVNDSRLNNLAFCAGLHLRSLSLENSDAAKKSKNSKSIYAEVLREVAGSLAVRILNPRYKVKSLADFESFLTKVGRRRLNGKMKETSIIASCVKVVFNRNNTVFAAQHVEKAVHRLNGLSLSGDVRLARVLGQVLADFLYKAMLQGDLSHEDMKIFYTRPTLNPHDPLAALNHYFHILRKTNSRAA